MTLLKQVHKELALLHKEMVLKGEEPSKQLAGRLFIALARLDMATVHKRAIWKNGKVLELPKPDRKHYVRASCYCGGFEEFHIVSLDPSKDKINYVCSLCGVIEHTLYGRWGDGDRVVYYHEKNSTQEKPDTITPTRNGIKVKVLEPDKRMLVRITCSCGSSHLTPTMVIPRYYKRGYYICPDCQVVEHTFYCHNEVFYHEYCDYPPVLPNDSNHLSKDNPT